MVSFYHENLLHYISRSARKRKDYHKIAKTFPIDEPLLEELEIWRVFSIYRAARNYNKCIELARQLLGDGTSSTLFKGGALKQKYLIYSMIVDILFNFTKLTKDDAMLLLQLWK